MVSKLLTTVVGLAGLSAYYIARKGLSRFLRNRRNRRYRGTRGEGKVTLPFKIPMTNIDFLAESLAKHGIGSSDDFAALSVRLYSEARSGIKIVDIGLGDEFVETHLPGITNYLKSEFGIDFIVNRALSWVSSPDFVEEVRAQNYVDYAGRMFHHDLRNRALLHGSSTSAAYELKAWFYECLGWDLQLPKK